MLTQSLLSLSLLATSTFAACTNPTVRRDWRSLTQEERTHFIDVQQQYWRQNPNAEGLSDYDINFTKLHRDNTPYAHLQAAFFPWHRRLLRDYEAALRTIDPSISLPYWNWAADNVRLASSAVWDDTTFGHDGDENTTEHCVTTGRYANWTLRLGGDMTDPTINVEHCLRRIWSRGIAVQLPPGSKPVVPDPKDIAGNITEFGTQYDKFRRWFEPHHGTIHLGVGGFSLDLNGDLTAVENSPNEPMFWLHHAFVDRTWWEYQQRGEEFKKAYGGKPNSNSKLPKDSPIWQDGGKTTDVMPPWQVTVESAMYADADDYCYTYEQ